MKEGEERQKAGSPVFDFLPLTFETQRTENEKKRNGQNLLENEGKQFAPKQVPQESGGVNSDLLVRPRSGCLAIKRSCLFRQQVDASDIL